MSDPELTTPLELAGDALGAVPRFAGVFVRAALAGALAALIGACGVSERPGPTVGLSFHSSVPEADREYITDGAYTWRTLGFRAMPWDADDGDVRWIIVRNGDLGGNWGGAFRGRDEFHLDLEAIGDNPWAIRAAAAHELGHLLLDTDDHLPAGTEAVMARGGSRATLTAADLDFACDVAGLCDTY